MDNSTQSRGPESGFVENLTGKNVYINICNSSLEGVINNSCL